MLNYLKNRRHRKEKAKALYLKAEAQARMPIFYAEMGVPDSVDGRFEMILLHCYLLVRRLKKVGDDKMAQALFDAFFNMMELSLREIGVGDLAVPKHMKRMMQGFNGRATHYETALENDSEDKLKNALNDALIQNVYGTLDKVEAADVQALSLYVLNNTKIQNVEEGFAPIDIKEEKHA